MSGNRTVLALASMAVAMLAGSGVGGASLGFPGDAPSFRPPVRQFSGSRMSAVPAKRVAIAESSMVHGGPSAYLCGHVRASAGVRARYGMLFSNAAGTCNLIDV